MGLKDKRTGRITADYKTADMYKYYKNKYKNPVDQKVYTAFLNEFCSEVLNLVIYNGIDYILPGRLGSLRIKKRKNIQKIDENNNLIHNFKVNFKETLKLWNDKYPGLSWEELKKIEDKPKIYHLNEHTDNYYFRWYWDRITCNVKNQSAYKFEPVRQKKREAAQAWKNIKNLKNIYYE